MRKIASTLLIALVSFSFISFANSAIDVYRILPSEEIADSFDTIDFTLNEDYINTNINTIDLDATIKSKWITFGKTKNLCL